MSAERRSKSLSLTLKIWRQKGPQERGKLVTYSDRPHPAGNVLF